MLACTYCANTVADGAVECEACGLRFERRGGQLVPVHPVITPGEPLIALDLRRDPLPGRDARDGTQGEHSMQGTPDGIVVTVAPRRAIGFYESQLHVRNACVSVVATALDPGLLIEAVLRRTPIGDDEEVAASMQYTFELSLDKCACRIYRTFGSRSASCATGLTDWVPLSGLQPAAALQVEFRAQGPSLEGWVNGHRATAVHEPILGVGQAGVRFESETLDDQHRRVLAQHYRLYEVKA